MTSPFHSPAADRNKQPILDALLRVLPDRGVALEIASGTGQHVAWFAAAMRQWTWQPSDRDDSGFDSIAAYVAQAGVANVLGPVVLDVTAPHWPSHDAPFTQAFDAIYCANMLHISPWSTCAGLMQGAARHLSPRGVLITYGPYLEAGVPTSPGNLAFNQSLRERDPAWGIRRLDDVKSEAGKCGLELRERREMPSNNLLLMWGRGD